MLHNDLFYELLSLSVAGFGMLALGVVHLLFKQAGWGRFLSGAAVVGGGIGIASFVGEPKHVQWVTGLLVGTWVLLSASLWGGCTSVTTRLTRFLRQPMARGGLTVGLGMLVIGYAVAKFEHDDNALMDQHMSYLETISSRPPLASVERMAKTDDGRDFALATAEVVRPLDAISAAETMALTEMRYVDKVIRVRPAADTSNCHGWVFTGGKYWVDGMHVTTILEANGYQAVTDPKPGDIAIYHDGNSISHTALVRYAGEGQLTMVESKWGWMGVYLHRVDQSVYGKDFTYYRSPRSGHLLVGLGGSTTTTDTPLASGTTELHSNDTTEE